MEKLASLAIVEPPKMDTSLAEKYLNENNFQDFPSSENVWLYNKDPKKIRKVNVKEINELTKYEVVPHSLELDFGRQLAKLLEKNEMMFRQLEQKLRNTDPTDVKNCIILISQQLQCPKPKEHISKPTWLGTSFINTTKVSMFEETPLYELGGVALALHSSTMIKKPVIITCQTTAPLCHFFVSLCSQLGLEISLIYMDRATFATLHHNDFDNISKEQGCTAVITEQADVDSALDALLYSTVTAPWRFSRVFVQESVYKDLKAGLAWKCQRVQRDSCVDAYTARGKTFSCDRLRDTDHKSDIPVEAYRTVKELLSLMNRQSTPYLSVWAEGSGLSNEIALNAASSMVWLNDYASFSGPPLASLPVYGPVYTLPTYSYNVKPGMTWWKLKDEERRDLMIKALKGSGHSQLSDELVRGALKWRRYNFVHVDDGKIWFGVEIKPTDSVFIVIALQDEECLLAMIHSILCGYGVVYKNCNKSFIELLDHIQLFDIPVAEYKDDNTLLVKSNTPYRYKVVQSRFGTVFAN